jgi:hypothetical protein
MDDEILTIYYLSDELLKAFGHRDHPQCAMNSAEIMTVALVAVTHCGGNFALARRWLHAPHWMPVMLSKSRFSRRLHRIKEYFLTLFYLLASSWKGENQGQIYNVDTFPVPVCDNIRISRCRLYREEKYRGYKASKRRYFYGLKLHMLITETGQPVEFFLTPGSTSDVNGLYGFDFDLPEGATIIADKAYNLYWFEDILQEAGIRLLPVRKKNSKRPHQPWERGLQWLCRQQVETSGSLIDRKLPKSIHAVTAEGFELKIVLFVLAFSLSYLLK